MTRDDYIINLEKALLDAKKGKKYIEICLNYARKLQDVGLPVIFDKRHLAGLLGMNLADLVALLHIDSNSLYTLKTIPKKNGTKRQIVIPCVLLKYIQRWILDNILYKIPISHHATGFRKESSILQNAQVHTSQECIINIDLKDFFPTITIDDVFRIFNYYGYTKEVSYTLAKLCTFDGVVPQGSPASPCISNIACLRLDKRLSELARNYHAQYTRYADDMTFSGPREINNMLSIVCSIIEDEGFKINKEKLRISFQNQRQEVTGLIVNGACVKISKDYKRKLQQEIYYCKKYGPYNHQEQINDHHAFFKEHLYGKAYYVYMVEPVWGAKFLAELDEVNWDY